ncbi:hypothetical protein [Lederbergia citrea]|uniref:Uncharacterized protein n=1 Tax=Lederbergia citrea TaxID=2833581 RepID=A0A942URN5_9BACI|nr:hypothetical protein [Lederbergia citrea]MBS4221724.1 hypothetical protein [Lederbergia citrea]
MKTYAREATIVALLIIILSMTFKILENGIGFTEILDFKTVFLGFATFGGAALGAMLAGKYTLSSVKEQIDYDTKKEIEKETISQQKYDIFLSIHLNLIRNEANRIAFMKTLLLSHNPYNVKPLEEIEDVLLKLKETTRLLFSIDPKYISVENYKLLGKINDKIYEIENSYKGFLATEEDEALLHIEMVESQAKNLLKIIEESK